MYIQGHGIPWGFPTLYVEIPYLINIHGQYINIHEVTDFNGGFLTMFSALRSNAR